MKKLLCFFALISITVSVFCQDQKSNDEILVEQAIVKFFDGLAALDRNMMEHNVTPDFLLLENGEVWNMDTLVNAISPMKKEKFSRTNHFVFLRTVITGNTAWTAYDNTAKITVNDLKRNVHWLESASLIKENGTWKIQLLHSTRIISASKTD